MALFSFNKVIELDKQNLSQGTSIGDFVVPTHQDQTQTPAVSNANISLIMEVYETEPEARARAEELIAGLTPSWDSLSPLVPPGPAVKVITIKRQSLHHIHGAWEAAFGPDVPDPLLKRVIVGVRLPCADATGAKSLQLVTATVASAISASIYRLTFVHNAITSFTDVDKSTVECYLAESQLRLARASAVLTISVPDTFNSRFTDALKSMPKSTAISNVASFIVLDIREVFAVLSAIAPHSIGGLTLPATVSPTADKSLLDEMEEELKRFNAKFPPATIAYARTFTTSPDRLGKELSDFVANPGGGSISNHPNADKFRLAAKAPADWDSFLMESAKTTFPPSRAASAVTSGEHVMKGGLERYILKNKDAATSYLDAHLGLNMDESQLLDVFFGMADAVEEAAKPTSSLGSGGVSGAVVPMPTAFGGSGMPPIHLHVPAANQKASTEADNRLINQLRADALAVQQDASAQKTLNGLKLIKDSNPDMFLKTIKNIDDERLLRLLNHCSDKDYASILQGGFEDLGLQLSSMRGVIERHLEIFIFGEHSSEPPERVTKAFRNARLGRIDKLKLLHLVDLDDSGTPASPLAALVKMKDRTTAFGKLSEALDRLQQILCITFPDQLGEIMTFMPKFKNELKKIIVDKNVAWASVNTWFKAITQKISRPALRHSMAEGEWGGPKFQIVWLNEQSDYNDSMAEAKLEALALSVLEKNGLGKHPRSETKEKKGKEQKKNKDLRDKLNKKKKQDDDDAQADPAAASRNWVPADEEMPDPDSNGKYSVSPGKGHPMLRQWNTDHPRAANGKLVCWKHHNLKGGCKWGGCKASPCSDN